MPGVEESMTRWLDQGHNTRWFVGAVVAFLVAIGLFTSLTDGEPENGSPNGARDACRPQVEAQLKAPSSAEFSGEVAVETEPGTWRVTGTVYADNSFGAAIGTDFTCGAVYRDGRWVAVARVG